MEVVYSLENAHYFPAICRHPGFPKPLKLQFIEHIVNEW
jgi:hypothetical protein